MTAVVLVEPEYPENIGYIARLVKNFSAGPLVLVNPKPDLDNELVRTRAMHGLDVLESAEIVESLEELKKRFDLLVGTSSKTASQYNVNRSFLTPAELKISKNSAFVFGRESKGLTNQELELCDQLVFIPTNPEYQALSISHAAAILLSSVYEKPEKAVAERELTDQLLRFWQEIIDKYYDDPRKNRIQSLIAKRALGRASLNSREAFGLLGVFRKIRDELCE
ncbi:MAG: hypothetical protein GOU99_00190 [Candidatus Altiarchaeota archaeon]|nr:hypothetical protein [Candidatus Altiarchaeota archaeon]